MKATTGLLVLFSLLAVVFPGFSQSAGFTYQGRLLFASQPANGIYDLRFTLYDAATDGLAVTSPLTNATVNVSNGLFTTTLNFGDFVFNGPARWLEIAVRANNSGQDYTVLNPRQPITTTPYAAFANVAGTAGIATNLFGGGAALTNLNGASIQPHSISSSQIDVVTDAAYRASGAEGGNLAVYIFPDVSNSVVHLSTDYGKLVSGELSLDFTTADIASAITTQAVKISVGNLYPKPFWLTLSNASATSIALSWPASWFWFSPTSAPPALSGEGMGLLQAVCDVNGNVIANWNEVYHAIDRDARDFISRAGITNTALKNALSDLVTDLKETNLWPRMLAVYPFAGGTAGAHSQNLVSTNFTIEWNGAAVSHDGLGVASDLSGDGYGNTHFDPAVPGGWQTNSAHLFIWIRTNSIADTPIWIGGYGSASYEMLQAIRKSYSGIAGSGLNINPGINSPVVSHSSGPVLWSRWSSTNEFLVAPGQPSGLNLTTSPANFVPSTSFGILAGLVPGTIFEPGVTATKGCLAGASIGLGIQPNEWVTLSNIWRRFETRLGR